MPKEAVHEAIPRFLYFWWDDWLSAMHNYIYNYFLLLASGLLALGIWLLALATGYWLSIPSKLIGDCMGHICYWPTFLL